MKQKRPYSLIPYDPQWNIKFQQYHDMLSAILRDEIIEIEHIGSTSIPGIYAKPQIDILVIVKKLENIKKYYSQMKEYGFEEKGDYTKLNEEYFIISDKEGDRLASIHTMQEDNPEIEPILTFRNILRSNAELRNEYSSKKQELFEKYPEDYPEYSKQKSVFMNTFLKKVFNH